MNCTAPVAVDLLSSLLLTHGAFACDADFDNDGAVDFFDVLHFISSFGFSEQDAEYRAEADLNQDGTVDTIDFNAFSADVGRADCPRSLPAFPGAVGPAAHSVGGRGGQVLRVTTLADAGPGSLREAIDAQGPRTIVFRVAGTIELASPLFIDDPYLTIAGQTAPGGGICIIAEAIGTSPIFLGTHDVVVRYLRIRAAGDAVGPFKDALSMGEGVGVVERVVFDHCSFSWANDEVVQFWSDEDRADGITIQHSIVSEGLNYDNHSRGLIVGSNTICEQITGVTIYANLFAHNAGRNPYVNGADARIVNNLIYNWDFLATQLAWGITCDVVANAYVSGPDTGGRAPIVHRMSDPWGGWNWGPEGVPSVHVVCNIAPNQPDPAGEQWQTLCELAGYGNGWGWPGDPPMLQTPPPSFRRAAPMPAGDFPIQPLDATSLEATLLPHVGASRRLNELGEWVNARDAVDARIVADVINRSGAIIDRPDAFPVLSPGVPYDDRDGDGMPDAYEAHHGLDPDDPTDGALDADSDRLMNLEAFLSALPPI